MIKDIIVSLPVSSSPQPVIDYATSVATTFGAHLSGVAFAFEPVIPGTVFDGMAASIVSTYRSESKKAGADAVAKFNDAARRAGLSSECHLLEAGPSGASELFGQVARVFDLSIVAQTDPEKDAPEELLVEGALFGAGRPVLVVPYIQKSGLSLNRVLVCWDGSRSAARAIGDAMPFLERSKAVEVITIAKHEGPRDVIPGVGLAHHLARHNLNVDLKQIVAGDLDVANTIMSHAADVAADLIVMGGYGHSRLREFVLGGATRGVLESMTVPTLMSH